jgi:succinate-semialdehyde dehydrogenase/glutarate-semialdehyde dehydrogenase
VYYAVRRSDLLARTLVAKGGKGQRPVYALRVATPATSDTGLPKATPLVRNCTLPVGVVAAFLAWNFPLLNVGFKLGPALAAGCSIIIRPSSSSPLSAYVLGEICREIRFPAGVINILCGPADVVATTISSSSIPRSPRAARV